MSKMVTRLNPETLPDASHIGYSQISVTEPGRLAFVSGQVAGTRDGSAVPITLEAQTAQVVENLGSALAAVSATQQDIVQMRIYMTDLNDDTMAVAMPLIIDFLDGAQPSLTGVGVVALAATELKIEVEMVVRVPD